MSLSELYALVGKLGIRIDNSNLQALMAAVDSNHNGVIEFEEFVHFIAADRYK
jgi:Ca2+-binding EF-hand superfamily protein